MVGGGNAKQKNTGPVAELRWINLNGKFRMHEQKLPHLSHLSKLYFPFWGKFNTCKLPRLSYNKLMTNKNEDFKKKVKDWLKSIKKDRQWLAEQCFVGKRAVDKWLSTARGIPAAKMALISQLMNKPAVIDFGNPPGLPESSLKNKLYVTLEPAIQDMLETQAHMNGMNLSAYCSLILEWASEHEGIMLSDILAMFEKKWQDGENRKQ